MLEIYLYKLWCIRYNIQFWVWRNVSLNCTTIRCWRMKRMWRLSTKSTSKKGSLCVYSKDLLIIIVTHFRMQQCDAPMAHSNEKTDPRDDKTKEKQTNCPRHMVHSNATMWCTHHTTMAVNLIIQPFCIKTFGNIAIGVLRRYARFVFLLCFDGSKVCKFMHHLAVALIIWHNLTLTMFNELQMVDKN